MIENSMIGLGSMLSMEAQPLTPSTEPWNDMVLWQLLFGRHGGRREIPRKNDMKLSMVHDL